MSDCNKILERSVHLKIATKMALTNVEQELKRLIIDNTSDTLSMRGYFALYKLALAEQDMNEQLYKECIRLNKQ